MYKPESPLDTAIGRGREHSYKPESVGGGGGEPLYKLESAQDTVVWRGREPLYKPESTPDAVV